MDCLVVILIFSEGPSASSNEYLDPSSEGWIEECLNDAEMQLNTEDMMYVPLILPSLEQK